MKDFSFCVNLNSYCERAPVLKIGVNLSIFSATDGKCGVVGGVSRSVPSSPGERSEKFGAEEGSQGTLDIAAEIKYQNKV